MPPHLLHKQRRKYILENITQNPIRVIADECGVDESTIDRDIAALKESGEWWRWLELELLRLHRAGDVDNATKYREVAKLYGKQALTEKVEASGTIFQLEVWRPEEKRDAEDKSQNRLSSP